MGYYLNDVFWQKHKLLSKKKAIKIDYLSIEDMGDTLYDSHRGTEQQIIEAKKLLVDQVKISKQKLSFLCEMMKKVGYVCELERLNSSPYASPETYKQDDTINYKAFLSVVHQIAATLYICNSVKRNYIHDETLCILANMTDIVGNKKFSPKFDFKTHINEINDNLRTSHLSSSSKMLYMLMGLIDQRFMNILKEVYEALAEGDYTKFKATVNKWM